jgi:hypothetical protein
MSHKQQSQPGRAGKAALLKRLAADYTGNSTANQRDRIMAAIRSTGSISTVEAVRYLDIIRPSSRIVELRQHGEPIRTLWTHEETEAGEIHRVARYVLDVKGVTV